MTDAETNPSTPKSSRDASHPRHPRFLAEERILSAHSPYSATERFVGLAILQHTNKSGCAWPSKETLAAACGVSPRTVQTALRGLCGGPHALFRRDLRRRGTPVYSIQGEKNLPPLEGPRGEDCDIQGEKIATSKGRRICSQTLTYNTYGKQRENAASVDVVTRKASTGQPPQARASAPIENNGAADPTLRRVRERQSEILDKILLLSQRTAADELDDASQTSRGRSYRSVEGCPTAAWGRATLDRLEARLEDLGAAQRPVLDDDRYTPEEAERVKREILAKRPRPNPARASEPQTIVRIAPPEPPRPSRCGGPSRCARPGRTSGRTSELRI